MCLGGGQGFVFATFHGLEIPGLSECVLRCKINPLFADLWGLSDFLPLP